MHTMLVIGTSWQVQSATKRKEAQGNTYMKHANMVSSTSNPSNAPNSIGELLSQAWNAMMGNTPMDENAIGSVFVLWLMGSGIVFLLFAMIWGNAGDSQDKDYEDSSY